MSISLFCAFVLFLRWETSAADVFFACSVLVFKRFLNCSEEPRNEPLPETLVNAAALDVLGVGLLPDLVLAC